MTRDTAIAAASICWLCVLAALGVVLDGALTLATLWAVGLACFVAGFGVCAALGCGLFLWAAFRHEIEAALGVDGGAPATGRDPRGAVDGMA